MSIKQFENITHDYSQKELTYYIPLLIRGLKTKIGKENAISTPKIIKGIHDHEKKVSPDVAKIRPERIRMMVRYIVVNDYIPGLIAGGKGYYIATIKKEIEDNIKGLDDRIQAMITKKKALIRQRDELFFKTKKLFQ